MTMLADWHGKGYTAAHPNVVKLDHALFLPDGKIIPAGTDHEQFETRDFGWWIWKDKDGRHVSKY
jgi:hypothetical protein